jgi:hypothetical protein
MLLAVLVMLLALLALLVLLALLALLVLLVLLVVLLLLVLWRWCAKLSAPLTVGRVELAGAGAASGSGGTDAFLVVAVLVVGGSDDQDISDI